jgi:hypothetical protein
MMGDEQDPESVRVTASGRWEGENKFVIDLAQKNAYFQQQVQFVLTYTGDKIAVRLVIVAPPQGELEISGEMQK